MKGLISLLFIPLLVFSQGDYQEKIMFERRQTQKTLLSTDKILNEQEREKIKSLNYYGVDINWRVNATFRRDRGHVFEMPTTTERKPKYRREGYLIFHVAEKEYRLTLYKNLELTGKQYKHYYFLPFKDATSPNNTYGGGRFIEINQKIKGKKADVIIDFNTAFNPYCVYSDRFSCPITPEENHLLVRIEAGEKLPIMRLTIDQ